MRQLFLIRHGQSTAPEGVMIGSSDYPLSPKGREQATHLAVSLAPYNLDLALTSPLLRARQTTEIIVGRLGLTTQVVEGLSEIDLGLFEGLTAGEARAKYPVLWAERGLDLVNTKVPGGESYAQLSVRVLPALDKALTANAQAAKIMIVAHRAVIQVIIARATGLPMEETVKLPIPYGGMEIIEGG